MGYYEEIDEIAASLGMKAAPRDRPLPFIAHDSNDLAEVVRERISDLSMTEDEVAAKAGVSTAAVQELEANGTGRLDDLYPIFDALALRPYKIPVSEF